MSVDLESKRIELEPVGPNLVLVTDKVKCDLQSEGRKFRPKLENYHTLTPYNLNDIGIESIMIYMKLKKLTNGRRGVPALHITAAPGRGE